MHDNQVEDRVRAALRSEGETLPLTITSDELERRLALRRRARNGRRLSMAAAAVGIVAIGSLVASSSGWFGSAGVGGGPTDAASDGPTIGPTDGGLPCVAVDPATTERPPTLIMGATPGDAMAYGGAITGYLWNGSAVDIDAYGDSPPAVPAGPPTERLEVLASEQDACLSAVTATATSGGTSVKLEVNAGGPARVVAFATPPSGEWQVLVHVEFSTTDGSPASSETIFRVDTRDRSGNTPLPSTLPEIPAPEGTVLVDSSSASVPGEPTGATEIIGMAPVPPRSVYRVDVVCLGPAPLRWSFGREGGLEIDFGLLAAGDQVCDGTLGSQILELGIPPREVPVFVEADPATAWHIVVSSIGEQPPFLPPTLQGWWNEEAGATRREAFGHCVSSSFGADQCGPNWETAGAAPIHVTVAGQNSVGFQLEDDWDIANARITAVAAGTTAPEYSVGFIDTASREIRVPIELDPGDWTLQVSLNARRGDASFGAFYNFSVTIGNQEAAIPTIQTTDPVGSLLNFADGDCKEEANVFMGSVDLDRVDVEIDANSGVPGWILEPSRMFHGDLAAAALAFGGMKLAVGAQSPWILGTDGKAHELVRWQTPKGRSVWLTGDSAQKVDCGSRG